MSLRPMLFSDFLVRAIIAKTKTQTRRPLKHAGSDRWTPGDIVWVREAWRVGDDGFHYRSSEPGPGPWKPSIHMPFVARRLTLVVTNVRFQLAFDASVRDIQAEGVEGGKAAWRKGWSAFYGPSNQPVVALTFELV